MADIASGDRNALVGGPFGSELVSRDYVESGVPVIRGANMGKGRWVSGDFVFVTHEKADSLSANCAKPGDLVFTQRGTIGQVALVPDDGADRYLISQSQMKLSVDPAKADALFLFYVFSSEEHQNYIQQNAIRTGVPHTNLSILRTTPLRMPELDEQKAIAKVLSTLDAKIELNQRMNEELEGLTKLLYDYWFVQFDFPISANQAAAMGNPKLEGKPYRASGGKMVYNQTLKREIPEGWAATTLSKFANITMGQSPSGDSYNQNGLGMVFFQGSTDFGWRYPQVREYTTAPSRLAKAGDILLSVRAPVGTLNIADQACCIGRGLAALNAKSGHDSFLFEVMLYFKTIFDRRNASGTTFGSITKDDLHSLEFACPQKDSHLLDAFEEKMKPAHKTILNNQQQNQELTKLRDWLLPMLMNGQVTVN